MLPLLWSNKYQSLCTLKVSFRNFQFTQLLYFCQHYSGNIIILSCGMIRLVTAQHKLLFFFPSMSKLSSNNSIFCVYHGWVSNGLLAAISLSLHIWVSYFRFNRYHCSLIHCQLPGRRCWICIPDHIPCTRRSCSTGRSCVFRGLAQQSPAWPWPSVADWDVWWR